MQYTRPMMRLYALESAQLYPTSKKELREPVIQNRDSQEEFMRVARESKKFQKKV